MLSKSNKFKKKNLNEENGENFCIISRDVHSSQKSCGRIKILIYFLSHNYIIQRRKRFSEKQFIVQNSITIMGNRGSIVYYAISVFISVCKFCLAV